CALVAGVSFGHEFQHGTFTMLLSQPIARAAIWRDKMLALLAAFASITALFVALATVLGGPHFLAETVSVGQERLRVFPLIPLCICAGAPFLTLAAGNALGGAILSLAVPGCCLTFAAAVHLVAPALGQLAISTTLLIVYSL